MDSCVLPGSADCMLRWEDGWGPVQNPGIPVFFCSFFSLFSEIRHPFVKGGFRCIFKWLIKFPGIPPFFRKGKIFLRQQYCFFPGEGIYRRFEPLPKKTARIALSNLKLWCNVTYPLRKLFYADYIQYFIQRNPECGSRAERSFAQTPSERGRKIIFALLSQRLCCITKLWMKSRIFPKNPAFQRNRSHRFKIDNAIAVFYRQPRQIFCPASVSIFAGMVGSPQRAQCSEASILALAGSSVWVSVM